MTEPPARLNGGSTPSERRYFLNIALGYWREEKARQAWLLTGAVAILVLLTLGVQLGINYWNRLFYDALDRRNGTALLHDVFFALGLVAAAAAIAVCLVHARMRLQIKWRGWLTRRLIGYWLADRRFYQMSVVENEGSNPEFRMTEDARLATEPIVDFAIGLATAVLTAVAFVGILWSVGGTIELPLGGDKISIPGYMVFAALAYSALASVSTLIISRTLVERVAEKNEGEAELRYELVRVRESAETIALLAGDADEEARLDVTISALLDQWVKVAIQQARLTWIINGNSVFAPIVPLLLGAPKYLSGSLSLGELMQLASAFVQVQVALNWLVENSIRLAEWNASARRVGALAGVLKSFDERIVGEHGTTIVLGDSPDESLHIRNLSVAQTNGSLVIEDPDLVIAPGEKVLIKGESGTGKSTLIRAMAGLWPWGSGSILRPTNATIEFMPQQPYMPLGTLRHVLEYPKPETLRSDEDIREAMQKCGLQHLSARLDEEDQWQKILSGGEQQRVAFARTLLKKPDIIIMDEATSALDQLSQARVMSFFENELKDATLLSVAHRPELEAYHTREIQLKRREGERSVHAVQRTYSPLRRVWRGLKKRLSRT
ncbi:MAG: ABC transporter ATP-binding protein/permease [Methylobacteriaceae bacterium]|nr:ABC transporter ATP-binding protein/permease [Methylobacteriaceae bacterium]